MAHLRERYLLSILNKTLGYSPVVGVLGHRQVGKTTLVESLAKYYFTLDQKSTFQDVKNDPELFIQQNNGLRTAIDECQLSPGLFPAIKEKVRLDKRPGQYILTGSVRFTSRKAIRESLTGRIINLELIPLTISELNKCEKPSVLLKILQTNSLIQLLPNLKHEIVSRKKLDKEIDLYKRNGGLPGLCFVREDNIRNQKIKDQLSTTLDRDIRLVYPTNAAFSQILELVEYLSSREGQKIKYSEIRREVGFTDVTLKKLLLALENIFIIRILQIVGDEKGFVCYFEDQAESLYLDPNKSNSIQNEGLIYRHIRQEFFYQLGLNYKIVQFSTRGGARVPFAIETPNSTLGILPIQESNPSRAELASAYSFLKFYEKSKILILNRESKAEIISDRILQLPTYMIV